MLDKEKYILRKGEVSKRYGEVFAAFMRLTQVK